MDRHDHKGAMYVVFQLVRKFGCRSESSTEWSEAHLTRKPTIKLVEEEDHAK